MVFLVLALTWAVVLTFWFRSRSQQAFSDSVTEFHHDLRVIERAAPSTRAAANRLRPASGSARSVDAGALVSTAVVAEATAPAASVPSASLPSAPLPAASFPAAPFPAAGPDEVAAVGRRHRRQRRRRDVLIVLAVMAAASFALTIVVRVPDVARAQIACDVALAGYIALLIRANRVGVGRRRRTVGSMRRLRSMRVVDDGRRSFQGGEHAAGWNLTADAEWDLTGVGDDRTAGLDAVTLLRPAVGH